jgi:hypothetical protein
MEYPMNKMVITIILLSIFETINAYSATTYTCQNQNAEMVISVSVHKNQQHNSFIIDSPQFEFISRGNKLQVVELDESLIIQATAPMNDNFFAQVAFDLVRPENSSVLEYAFDTRVRVTKGSVVEIPVSCQAIAVLE